MAGPGDGEGDGTSQPLPARGWPWRHEGLQSQQLSGSWGCRRSLRVLTVPTGKTQAQEGPPGEAGEAGSRASFTPAGRASAHARLCRARARVALWPLLRPSCCPSPGKAVLSGRRDGVAVSPFRPPTHPLPVRGAQLTADGVRLVPRGWRTERRRGPRPRRCGGSGGGCRRPPAASCACAWRRSSCRSWGTGSAPSAAAQVSQGARGAGRGREVARGLRAGGAARTGCRGPSRAATLRKRTRFAFP